jgi:hypothetical protein
MFVKFLVFLKFYLLAILYFIGVIMKILSITILILCVSLGFWGCGEEEDTGTAGSEYAGADTVGNSNESSTWNAPCISDDDCSDETTLCVKSPQNPPEQHGYCSIPCSVSSECDGSDLGWTCNVVGGCENPLATWCGPESEIEVGGGVLTACN